MSDELQETAGSARECAWCQRPVPPSRGTKPRQYCRQSCRQAAYEQRKLSRLLKIARDAGRAQAAAEWERRAAAQVRVPPSGATSGDGQERQVTLGATSGDDRPERQVTMGATSGDSTLTSQNARPVPPPALPQWQRPAPPQTGGWRPVPPGALPPGVRPAPPQGVRPVPPITRRPPAPPAS